MARDNFADLEPPRCAICVAPLVDGACAKHGTTGVKHAKVEVDQRTIADDRIAEIARTGFDATTSITEAELRAICDELLYRRRQSRKDSRRAEQVKRLRWMAETLVSKVEALVKRDEEADTKEVGDG